MILETTSNPRRRTVNLTWYSQARYANVDLQGVPARGVIDSRCH